MHRSALSALLLLLAACGGQPRTYQVAIDRTPLGALPGSCYQGGAAPAVTDKATNTVLSQRWTLLEGEQGTAYLHVGDLSGIALGDAERVSLSGDAISGGPMSFTSTRTQTDPTRSLTTAVTVTFTQLDALAKGSLKLDSSSWCTGACSRPNCAAELPFVARRLDATAEVSYPP